MKKAFTLLCILAIFSARAQAVSFNWAKQIDNTTSMCYSKMGNLITTGTVPLITYDGNGQEIFRMKNTGNGNFTGTSVLIDTIGNIFLSGTFDNTLILGGVSTQAIGNSDGFVAKINSVGTVLWIKTCGGMGYESISAMVLDKADNIYITGAFQASIALENTTLTGNGGNNVFVAKYDGNGSFQWAQKADGNTSNDYVGSRSIAFANGTVFVTGTFDGNANFYSTKLTTGATESDAYIAAFNSSTSISWVKQIHNADINIMKLDPENNLCLAGNFSNGTDFDNIHLQATKGLFVSNIFIAKLDFNGKAMWAQRAGSDYSDYCGALAVDSKENFYIAGSFSDTATFGNTKLISNGEQDLFVAKYDKYGNKLWLRGLGADGEDAGVTLCVNNAENSVYLIGTVEDGPVSVGNTMLTGFNIYFLSELGDINTGIEPEHTRADWQIFPNPCSGTCYLSIDKSLENNTLFSIIDLAGKQIQSGKLDASSGIALQGLASGMYMLVLQNGNDRSQQKFIVQ